MSDAMPMLSVGEAVWRISRRKRYLVVGALMAATAAVAFSVLAPPRYAAVAQVLIDPRNLQLVEREIKPSTSNSEAGVVIVESESRVLASDSVLRRVVMGERLADDEEFYDPDAMLPAIRRQVVSLFSFAQARAATKDDPELEALRTLRKKTTVYRTERTYVVDVQVATNDPEKSARIANAIVQRYLDQQVETRAEAARRASEAFSGRLGELAERVRIAEDRVQQFNTEHDILGAAGELINEQQLAQLNTQLVAASARVAQERARYEQIRNARGNPDAIPEAVASDTLRALRDRHAIAAGYMARLSAELLPRHPAMVTAREEKNEVAGLIDQEIGRIAKAVSMDLERAVATERSIQRDLDGLKRRATRINAARVRQRELEREANASRLVYETALVRMRETRELEEINPTNAQVITTASPPDSRQWPPRLLILLPAAMMFGIGAGGGLAVLRGAPRARPADEEAAAGTESA